MKWRLIQSAPLDRDVLVYIKGAGAGLEYEIAHCSSDDPDRDWYPSPRDLAAPFDMPPTHWMPLPDAPE